MKPFILAALISGFLVVALGAFGGHMVEDAHQATWRTAVIYQMFHTLAWLLLAQLAYHRRALQLMILGTGLFSGSLYLLVLTQVKMLGFVTPVGGCLLLVAWLWLIVSFIKSK